MRGWLLCQMFSAVQNRILNIEPIKYSGIAVVFSRLVFCFFLLQALDVRHSGDASVQGLPGGQHHPADSAVQGAGQVQRGKLDGGSFKSSRSVSQTARQFRTPPLDFDGSANQFVSRTAVSDAAPCFMKVSMLY